MVRNEGDRLRRVIVCSPRKEYFRAGEPEEHNIAEIADPLTARRQHDLLKSVMADEGCEVIVLHELEGHPNSVFTRDTAVLTPEGFIRMRMGLPSRSGEEDWIAEALEALDVPCAGSVEAPGTAEGGDVILAGRIAFIGRSGRTNAAGADQVRAILARQGYDVRTHDIPAPFLHLGGAMSMIGPQRVLCAANVFDASFLAGLDVLTVPGASFAGANVICLAEDHVVACRSGGAAAGLLLAHGVRVHITDLSEFIKGSGGPTCLILPVDRRQER